LCLTRPGRQQERRQPDGGDQNATDRLSQEECSGRPDAGLLELDRKPGEKVADAERRPSYLGPLTFQDVPPSRGRALPA
jgi:hypothetical protein